MDAKLRSPPGHPGHTPRRRPVSVGVTSLHSILLKNPLPVSAALGGGRGWRDPDEVEFGPVQ